MILQQASIDLDCLRSELLKDRSLPRITDAEQQALVTQSRVSLAQTRQSIDLADGNLVRVRDSAGPSRNLNNAAESDVPETLEDCAVARSPGNDTASISFLPNTIPETIQQNAASHELVAVDASMDVEVPQHTAEHVHHPQADDDATQEISQAGVEEYMKSMRKVSRAQRDAAGPVVSGQEEDDAGDERIDEALEDTYEEGDSQFLDLASSFAAAPIEHESIAANSSPSQSQPALTQFPESQRFKTPATAGRKRDRSGNVLDTPAQSRNPFAKHNGTPTNVVGLSQAFANTQAASSPFVGMPPSELRSDRPSPGLDLERRIQQPPTSSPIQLLSEIKRGPNEPASQYFPIGSSQVRRRSDTEEDIDPEQGSTQASRDEVWSTEDSYQARFKRAKEREDRAREQLKMASSPLSPAKRLLSTRQRRVESERPAARPTSARTVPSSPPVLDAARSVEEEQYEVPMSQQDGDGSAKNHGDTYMMVEASKVQPGDKARSATLIPATTKRMPVKVAQSFHLAQPSPSARQTRSKKRSELSTISGSDPVKVANSQRSVPSTQEAHGRMQTASSGDSVDVIPASPGAELVPTQPTDSTRRQHSWLNDDGQELDEDATNNFIAQGLSGYTVPESSAGVNGRKEQDLGRSFYMTAPTNHAPTSASSIPTTRQGRKRKRMEELSQEDIVPSATQNSNLDFVEALGMNNDPELAQLLASSQDEDPIVSRKRVRLHTPPMEIAETRSSAGSDTSDIDRHSSSAQESDNAITTAETGKENDDVEGSPNNELDDLMVDNTTERTPPRRSSRKSTWEVGESPKARYIPKASGLRAQASTAPPLRSTKRTLQKTAKKAPRPISTMPAIEEASPDPLAQSIAPTAPSVHQQASKEVIAPSMVFVYFNDRSATSFYPARCLSKAESLDNFTVKWPGYDPEVVPDHKVASLDLRLGDEVKVALDGFPKGDYIIQSLHYDPSVQKQDDVLMDIYGHTHAVLKPKKIKKSVPKDVNLNRPIAINDMYIGLNTFKRMSSRPATFKTFVTAKSVSGIATPPIRAMTPTTPSSRSRHSAKLVAENMHEIDGIFSTMVFALSFSDKARRKKISELLVANGAIVLGDSFVEILDKNLDVRPQFTRAGFTALITDGHSRKLKYMEALALGLPCLHDRWVETSVYKQTIIEWQDYLLPAGVSDELAGAVRSRIVALVACKDFKLTSALASRPRYFQDSSVVFVTENRETSNKSSHLFFVRIMGADNVVEVDDLAEAQEELEKGDMETSAWLMVDNSNFEAAQAVVSGNSSKSRRRSKSKQKSAVFENVKVVDSEFVMQSLIMGRLSSAERYDL